MSDQEFTIYRRLLEAPDSMYVLPDQTKVYLLDETQKQLYVFTGNFKGMSNTEINQAVCVLMNHG